MSPGSAADPGRNAPPSGLLTDRYELTMLDAALASGAGAQRATFEVFTRRLPPGRAAGVFAGLGRLLGLLETFRFGPDECAWLADEGVVSEPTLDWLASYRFSGSLDAYAEGEWYTAGSPVLTVEGTFAEAVLLETVVLSVLNHDSAVAAAASLIVEAAGDRPVIEMGSRRTDPEAAVAAATAAWVAGFASTSNLEAGRRWGVPTAGTAAHAFVLAHRSEREAFEAQVAAVGPATTLLVDTYDLEEGIRTAVAVAGPALGAVRIDSGDPALGARRARGLLDALGAPGTRVIITGDLDAAVIASLRDDPVDGYGVGTSVVGGLGHPTAGFVYKLVAVGDAAGGGARAVAKRSPGKASVGGRKLAWRESRPDWPEGYEAPVPVPPGAGGVLADVVVAAAGAVVPPGGRPLQRRVMTGGEVVERPDPARAREWHRAVRAERAAGDPLVLVRRGAPELNVR